MKYFIITVDTEGDNLWEYKFGKAITTKNANYIQPFQTLCEKYNFKPVYLTNFEMAQDINYVKKAKYWLNNETCEIGIHLHAWNNPPMFNLEGSCSGNPYLIEYPEEIMRAKFQIIYELLEERFGIKPVSHRAGRWAMDDRYFSILEDFHVLVDCSHTPGLSWASEKGVTMCGSDYTNVSKFPTKIGKVLEVPIPVIKTRLPAFGNLKHRLRGLLIGNAIYLRPASASLTEMKYYIDCIENIPEYDYVEFMIHSSELMPGGSPYFQTKDSVNAFYQIVEQVFQYAKNKGYIGITLKEYYKKKINEDRFNNLP